MCALIHIAHEYPCEIHIGYYSVCCPNVGAMCLDCDNMIAFNILIRIVKFDVLFGQYVLSHLLKNRTDPIMKGRVYFEYRGGWGVSTR